jgi:hypothetical protein
MEEYFSVPIERVLELQHTEPRTAAWHMCHLSEFLKLAHVFTEKL